MRKHRHWDTIIRGGVASHHAGHMPAWKLAIERLMSAGLLDAIFATATVAAGVDFPARTVVFTNIDVRTGQRLANALRLGASADDGPRRTPRARPRRLRRRRARPSSGPAEAHRALCTRRPTRWRASSARPTRRCSICSTPTKPSRRCAISPSAASRAATWRDASRASNASASEAERRIREKLDEAGCDLAARGRARA